MKRQTFLLLALTTIFCSDILAAPPIVYLKTRTGGFFGLYRDVIASEPYTIFPGSDIFVNVDCGGLGTKSCRANRISHPSYPELTTEALTIIENKIADEVSLGKFTGKFIYNNELYIQFEETGNNNGSNSRITIRKLSDAKALGLI